MRVLTAPLALSLTLALSTAAAAQTPATEVPVAPGESAPANSVGTTVATAPATTGPSVWGILGGWYHGGGFGVGARYMLPLPVKPLLTQNNLRDAFALEFGADFFRYSWDYGPYGDFGVNLLTPVVGAMWNIWLNDQIAVYPKLDLGYSIAWFSGSNTYNAPSQSHFYWSGNVGAMYRLNNAVALRGELGYAGLRLGASWIF
jgi:hypothetical protein